MFRGLFFIVSTMQEETTPIFKRLWYDWTQQQPGIEPTSPLGQCWVPPIVAFYDQQGLLRTSSLPGSSIRSPHPGSPLGRPLLERQRVSLHFISTCDIVVYVGITKDWPEAVVTSGKSPHLQSSLASSGHAHWVRF